MTSIGKSYVTRGWVRTIGRCFALLLTVAVVARGQIVTCPNGELLVGTGLGNAPTCSQVVLDAAQFDPMKATQCSTRNPLTQDWCGQIQAAICASPNVGATPPFPGITIDARGLTLAQLAKGCASNPFATPTDPTGASLTSTPVTLLLPPQTVTTSATWFLPKYAKVIGQNQTVTTIGWNPTATPPPGNCTSGFTAHCVPVICIGPATVSGPNLYCDTPGTFTNTPRVQLSGLRIDCNNVANSVGLANITGQEQSWFQNGGVENCQNAGVFIGPTGLNSGPGGPGTQPDPNQVQNSGPWTNLLKPQP